MKVLAVIVASLFMASCVSTCIPQSNTPTVKKERVVKCVAKANCAER